MGINDVIATDFRRILESDSVAVHDVIYTPRDGEPETARVQVRLRETIGEFQRPDGRTFRGEIELDFVADDCPTIRIGDEFRFDGVDYKVDRSPRTLGPIRTVFAILIQDRFKGKPTRLLPTGG